MRGEIQIRILMALELIGGKSMDVFKSTPGTHCVLVWYEGKVKTNQPI